MTSDSLASEGLIGVTGLSGGGSRSGSVWVPPSIPEIMRWPLPHPKEARDRWLVRAVVMAARGQLRAVIGVENLSPANDPFIIGVNHSTRREAVLVPAVLMYLRGGRVIHFLADWNYRLYPGLGMVLRRSGTITVTNKPAKPRILNLLKPFFEHPKSGGQRALEALQAGASVGIFPEGTVNRDPKTLLQGRVGMARMSLRANVPVIPAGIRYPDVPAGEPIPENAAMEVHIGKPIFPDPAAVADPTMEAARRWHGRLMTEIGYLSGRAWNPTEEKNHAS